MIESEFKINERNVFISKTQNNGYIIICLCVNDMLIVNSSDKMIKSTKDNLNSRFDIKDIGLADFVLRI